MLTNTFCPSGKKPEVARVAMDQAIPFADRPRTEYQGFRVVDVVGH